MKKIHKATLALAGALLLGTGLFTACPHNTDPGTDTPPSKDDDVTIPGGTVTPGDFSSYYKKYFVKAGTDTGYSITDWGAGSSAAQNEDKTWTITASDSMWGGNSGIVAAFAGLDEGTLANYEYIVFTANLSDFDIDTSQEGGNYGVNVKIPDVQKSVTNNTTNSDGTITYYIKISEFGNDPATATEFALIVGGSGEFVLNELYLAATDDPSSRPVTEITISPVSVSITKNGTQQFTVRDSNLKNVTSDTVFALSGTAATGSSITKDGLLTVGETTGALTITATYTAGGKDFTAQAKITVLGEMTNLVSKVELEKYTDSTNAGNEVVSISDNTVTVNKPAGTTDWGEWSSQLFLTVSKESGNIFETGKKYYISVTVESDADLGGCIWKGDDNAIYFIQQGISYTASEARTLTQEVDFTASFEKFQCIFSFGANAASAKIKLSDFTVYDITE